MTRTRKDNLWEVYAAHLASEAKRLSDFMVTAMMGGDSPPGVTPVRASEQLRRFMLLSVPRNTLDPQRLAEADELWATHYAHRSETEIKKWALTMTHEYQRLTAPAVEEAIPEPEGLEIPDLEVPNA